MSDTNKVAQLCCVSDIGLKLILIRKHYFSRAVSIKRQLFVKTLRCP